MGQDKDKTIAIDFQTAWNLVKQGKDGGLFAADSLYGVHTSLRHYNKSRKPVTHKARTYRHTPQNAAIAAYHASNNRCMNTALDSLEKLATKARYGVRP